MVFRNQKLDAGMCRVACSPCPLFPSFVLTEKYRVLWPLCDWPAVHFLSRCEPKSEHGSHQGIFKGSKSYYWKQWNIKRVAECVETGPGSEVNFLNHHLNSITRPSHCECNCIDYLSCYPSQGCCSLLYAISVINALDCSLWHLVLFSLVFNQTHLEMVWDNFSQVLPCYSSWDDSSHILIRQNIITIASRI